MEAAVVNARTKAKGPAIAVPQTDEEADELLRIYGEELRTLADLETEMNTKIAKTKATYETEAAPHRDSAEMKFQQLQAWAEANRARLTQDGKTKTVELGNGKVSWRLRPAAVKIAGKIEDVIATLRALKLSRFIRTKYEINRERMLQEPKRAAGVKGVRIVDDVEDFIVEPIGLELSETKQ